MVVDRMARSGVGVATAACPTFPSPEVVLRRYRKVKRPLAMLGCQKRTWRGVASGVDMLSGVASRLGHFPGQGAVIQRPWNAAGE